MTSVKMPVFNQEIATDISVYLNEKYNEEFTILGVGDRIDTTHAKVTAIPNSNPDVVFTIICDYKEERIYDDYRSQTVIYKLTDEIKSSLADSGYTCAVQTRPIAFGIIEDDIDTSISYKEYSTQRKYDYLRVNIVAKIESGNEESFVEVLRSIISKCEVDMELQVYCADDDSLNQSIEGMKTSVWYSPNLIMRATGSAKHRLGFFSGEFTKTISEYAAELRGEE